MLLNIGFGNDIGFDCPVILYILEFADFFKMLGCEIEGFCPVIFKVVEFPFSLRSWP